MQNGHEVFNSHGDVIIQGYDKFIPEFNQQTFVAIAFIIAGMALVCVIEEISSRKAKTAEVELKKE